MLFKFVEMLYQMYGDGFEEVIEKFADGLMTTGKQDLGQDELFIEWAEYIKGGF